MPGAERHTEPDLRCPLRDRVGHHDPIDAERGQRKAPAGYLLGADGDNLEGRTRQALLRTRTINELAGLSDQHLKDIGVERREIGAIVDSELQRLRRSDLTWHK